MTPPRVARRDLQTTARPYAGKTLDARRAEQRERVLLAARDTFAGRGFAAAGIEEIVAREFALKRYIRAHSAEKYLIYHSTTKRPCGQIIVVDDGYDLFLTMVLYPNFGWDEAAYHLEGDPEGRTFAEILVDVVATEVIEPWGGGKWHLEVFRSVNPEPEDWNGEM